MNKILNFMFIISIPCYIWDWYNLIFNNDTSFFSCLGLIALSIYFAFEIPIRIQIYRHFNTIWYPNE